MSFRDHLIRATDARLTVLRSLDVRQYAEYAKTDAFAGPMITAWAQLFPEPFRGITTDGHVQRGLFTLRLASPGEAAPTQAMVTAATALLAVADEDTGSRLRYPVDAHEWRSWANPEFIQHDTGLRLDEIPAEVRDAALGLIEATLSDTGYALVRKLMAINEFLGDIVELPRLMNQYSYHFALYGEPSSTEPWGWQLFGHHVALNAVVIGAQLTLTPAFLGAEPTVLDNLADQGTAVFADRIELARHLMATLPVELQRRVQVYRQMVDPAMPAGRIHPGDERTLAGCFQDNRIIPLEGVPAAELPEDARQLLKRLLADFLSYLPAGPFTARMREVDARLADTWFSWIGGWEQHEPFYFRIQSPVILAELDHHCGVFLDNSQPAPFHIHTIVRTPNAGDYGRPLLEQHLGHPLTH